MHSDFLDLLRSLNAHRVRYLIIGGYAYSLHVEPRFTKDIDLWIEASLKNAGRLLQALRKFGAPVDNLTESDLARPGLLYVFGVPPLRVDVLNRIKGQDFTAAYARRVRFRFEGLTVPVVCRADLVRLKRAAGRPQDLVDLRKLELVSALARPHRPAKPAGRKKRKKQ
jgi:predicted nucleotidyltransferase